MLEWILCVVMAIKFRSFSKKNIPKIKHVNIRSHDMRTCRMRGWHESVWSHVHVLQQIVV